MKGGLTIDEFLPRGWRDLLGERGPCGIGFDVATTTKKTSNPSGIALIQQVGLDYIARLVLRFKTDDPEVSEKILRELLDLPHGLRVRKICVDATNERFFAATLRSRLAGEVVVEPIIQSEVMVYRGEQMTVKQFLGNLFINTIDDGRLLLPSEKWLENDIRQVQRSNGTFEANVDAQGNHADAFDGIKLGLHALNRLGGPVEAAAAKVGTFGNVVDAVKAWVKNPLARARDSEERRLC